MVAPSTHHCPIRAARLVYCRRQLPVILLSLCHRPNLLSFYGVSRHSALIAYLTARRYRLPPRLLLSLFSFTPQRRKIPPFCGLTSVNDARGKRHAGVTTLSAPCCLLRTSDCLLACRLAVRRGSQHGAPIFARLSLEAYPVSVRFLKARGRTECDIPKLFNNYITWYMQCPSSLKMEIVSLHKIETDRKQFQDLFFKKKLNM